MVCLYALCFVFFFSSRRRHTRLSGDWSSDVCSSDLPAISSSVVPFSSCPQSLPASVFSNESTLCMRWPKYWSFSFSISPSKEHPGLISFGSPCSPRDSQESSPTPQFKSISSSVLSFLHSPTLTSIHDHWKNQDRKSVV